MKRIVPLPFLLFAALSGRAAPCPPPFIACPLPTSVMCGTPISFTPPTAIDLCTGTSATVTALSTTTNGICPQFVARVWKATDSQGQMSTCTQTVAIVDTVAPMFCAGVAGNLVPNPSFEMNVGCPSNFSGQIVLATPWIGANGGSSDYYHTCALHPDLDVPANIAGNQAPSSGQAYAGIHAADTAASVAPSPYREYIQAKLLAPLVGGRIYSVAFRVSLSDTSRRAVDNLGAHLSVGALSIPTSNNIPVIPQVRNPAGSYLTDKTGWTLIQGEFTAAGGEDYVTMGNFYDNTNTIILPISGTQNWGYYYVDDVSVQEVCCPPRTVECRNPLGYEPPVVTDACSGTNVTVALLSDTVVSNVPCAAVHRLVWQALDRCSNSATCTQLVTVVDTTAPLLFCPQEIRLATCSNSAAVYFKATALDCDTNVLITCAPPSGSVFPLGTTFVTCTATDACGKTNACTFPLEVIPGTNFWESFPGGFADCYLAPVEPASRGACLTGLYPDLKDFDDPSIDKSFGVTWELPAGPYLDGWLHLWMKDVFCAGGSEDDTIRLGLLNCVSPAWAWTRSLGPSGPDPGLQASPWCNIPECDRLFSLPLAALPTAAGGTMNILPHLNTSLRLDLLVGDDTRVDSARLLLQRCAPQNVIGGLVVTPANARLVHGPGNWTLAREAGATNLSASFDLGSADGARLNFEDLTFAGASGRVLRLSASHPNAQAETELLRLSSFGTGLVRLQLGQPPPGATQMEVRTLSNEVVVASNTVPATAGIELMRFPASASILQAGAFACGNVFVVITNGTHGSFSCEARGVFPAGYVFPRLATMNLGVDGWESVTLRQPELALVDRAGSQSVPCEWIYVPARGPSDDLFIAPSGNAVARAAHGQLSLSALNPGRSAPMGFVANVPGSGSNEFRARIEATFGRFSRASSNSSINFSVIMWPRLGLAPEDEVITLSFSRSAGPDLFWTQHMQRGHSQVPLRRVVLWNNSDIPVVEAQNPTSVSVSEPPTIYWPSTGWFIEADTCHRLLWPFPVTVNIDGTNYEATELRILAGGGGQSPPSVKSLRVDTLGAESLVFARLETGPITYRLEPPMLDRGDVIIRGNNLGAVFESAPTVRGPWSAMFIPSGESRVKITNAPPQYYRIKGR